MAAPRTAERVDREDPAQQLRPAAAPVGLRGRHPVGGDHRGLLVEAGLAPDAAGPVGIPAVVTLEHLASIGPRLSGSPNYAAAVDWLLAKYQSWGVTARKEQYGTWRGWRQGVAHLDLIAPRVQTLDAKLLA